MKTNESTIGEYVTQCREVTKGVRERKKVEKPSSRLSYSLSSLYLSLYYQDSSISRIYCNCRFIRFVIERRGHSDPSLDLTRNHPRPRQNSCLLYYTTVLIFILNGMPYFRSVLSLPSTLARLHSTRATAAMTFKSPNSVGNNISLSAKPVPGNPKISHGIFIIIRYFSYLYRPNNYLSNSIIFYGSTKHLLWILRRLY